MTKRYFNQSLSTDNDSLAKFYRMQSVPHFGSFRLSFLPLLESFAHPILKSGTYPPFPNHPVKYLGYTLEDFSFKKKFLTFTIALTSTITLN